MKQRIGKMKAQNKKTKITILSTFAENSAIWRYGYFLNKYLSLNKKYSVKFVDLWKNKSYRSDTARGWLLLNGIETENTDVLILVSPMLCNSLKKSYAKLKLTIVHDLHPITHPNEVPLPVRMIVNETYKNMSQADVILPVSDFTKKEVQRIFHVKKEMKTMHGGIDHGVFRVKNKKKSRNEKVVFLHVGRNDPRKNFMFVLELLERFEDAKLIKIGSISNKEKDYINKHKLNVEIINSASDEKLAEYYNKATLLLFPSTYEGLGLPPVEAMACGCPVIAANNTGLREVCIKDSLLPLKIEQWEGKIKKIIENRKYRNKIIKDGLKKSKSFDWKAYAEEVEKIITRNIAKKRENAQ